MGNKLPMENQVKKLRIAAGLTQGDLAQLAGTGKSQVVKLESGERRLSDHWAQRLAPHLGVQPYELFMPQGSKTPLRMVPLVGYISCGDWREAIERPEGYVAAVNGGPKLFALKATGDSMDELIRGGGYVYVDPDDIDLHDARVYAVMNGDNETTAKMFRTNPARLTPCSSNPTHREILIGTAPFTLIGRIVGTYSPL